MNIIKNIFIITLIVLTMQACSAFMPRSQIETITDVKKNEVILVGKIVFNPPLRKEEQHITTMFFKNHYINTFMLSAGNNYDVIRDGSHDFSEAYMTKLGETYYITADNKKPFYMSGGFFYTYMDGRASETTSYELKGGIKLQPKPTDKALYIGTITFVRDEFFNIKDVTISQNGYKQVNAAFKKKFNTGINLKKAALGSAK